VRRATGLLFLLDAPLRYGNFLISSARGDLQASSPPYPTLFILFPATRSPRDLFLFSSNVERDSTDRRFISSVVGVEIFFLFGDHCDVGACTSS